MFVRTIQLTLIVCMAAACAAIPAPPIELAPEIVKSAQRYKREYVLQPGDQLEVAVFRVPELSRTVIVRPDGYVSLLALNDVRAAGMTVPGFSEELRRLYSARLADPEVTVTVVNPRAAVVHVVGDVNRAGPVPIRDAPTAALAIAASGGTTRTAALGNIAIIRMGDDGYLRGFVVERQRSGETALYMALSNLPLEAGDIIIVPESGRSQLVRFVQDYINTPLGGVNQILAPYFQYRVLDLVIEGTN